MQKVLNIRSSQFGLKESLDKFAAVGWRILSVSKGSELSRFVFSLRWTILLESVSDDATDDDLYDVADKITSDSWKCQLAIFFGILVGCGLFLLLIFLPSALHSKG